MEKKFVFALSSPRSSPCAQICKMKVQQNHASYCTMCAYAKGICAICGVQVLDTTMYKMSEGGNFTHKLSNKDESAFKSPEQIAREGWDLGFAQGFGT